MFNSSFLSKTARLALLAMGLGLLAGTSQAATITISNLWSISTTNGRPYLTNASATSYTERGVAYNAVNNHAYIVSRQGGVKVAILDGDTGAELGFLNVSGISGGTFALSTIAVAEDGVIYAANLTTGSATSPYKIYRWGDELSAPTVAYSGNPADADSRRFGESFDVRGSGVNTEILASALNTNLVAIFKSVDGENFSSTRLDVSGLPAIGDLGKGIAFGPTNTFYGKNNSSTGARFCSYDTGAGTATLLSSFSTVALTLAPIDVDPVNNLMAGVESANALTPHNLRVYDLSSGSAVQLFSTNFPAPAANNGNIVGQVQMRGDRIFAIDTQNGVIMLKVNVDTNPAPPGITLALPATNTIVEGGYATITMAASGEQPLYYQWFHEATPIPNNNTNFLNLTNVTLASAGIYSVTVSNDFGTTNTSATVIITPTALTSVMTKLWQKPPGSLFFLGNDNNHRGMAYNKLNNHVIVVSRTPTNGVHVLDGNTGEYLHSLDMTGVIPAGTGNGTFAVNMVACTDAGEVFVANLTTGPANGPVRVYYYADDAPTTVATLPFSEVVGTNRWGDTLDVRGSGGGAELLFGGRNGKQLAVIIPGFGPQIYDVPEAANAQFGLACVWGEGDTVWGKTSGAAIRQVQLDVNALTGGVVRTISGYLNMSVVGFNSVNSNLAGITTLDTPSNVRLLDLTQESAPELDTEFFPTDNANANGVGSVKFAPGRLFALDANNGLIAMSVAPRLHSSRSGNTITFTWETTPEGPHRLQSSPTLSPATWTDVMDGGTSGAMVPIASSGNLFFRLTN